MKHIISLVLVLATSQLVAQTTLLSNNHVQQPHHVEAFD